MPREDRPVVCDENMRLWQIVADSEGIVTSKDLSPSLRLRRSFMDRVQSENDQEAPLTPYQRQLPPTFRVRPQDDTRATHNAHPTVLRPLHSAPSNPQRPVLQSIVDRKENEINILRQELHQEEFLHQMTKKNLDSYKQLVHDFCVLHVQQHRQHRQQRTRDPSTDRPPPCS